MFAVATTAAILAGSLTGANAVVAKTEKPDYVEENGGVENVEVDEPVLIDDVAPAPMGDMADDLVPCSQTCYYQVVAAMDWTAERHPRDFPAPIDGDEMTGARFPPLWTVAHDSSFVLWREEDTATEGMKEIAELGTGEIFLQDVEECGESCGEGQGLECMPTSGKCSATGEVRVTEAYPYISIATMLAPSPDWFTGLDSEPLCVDGHWVPHFEKGVNAYDGGTLSGDTFRSDSEPTMPYEPIFSFGGIEPASDSIFYNEEQGEILPVGLIRLVRTHCDGPTNADGEMADDMIDLETDEVSDEESEDVSDSGCGMGGQPVCAGDDLIDREFECDHGYVSDDQGICVAYEESKKDKTHMDMDMGMPHMDGEHVDEEHHMEPHMDGEHVEEEPHMDGDAEPEEHRRERRPRDDKKEEAEPHMDGEHVEEEPHMNMDGGEHMAGEDMPHMSEDADAEEPHMDMDGDAEIVPEDGRRERRARDDKKVEEEPHMDGEHVEEEPHMDGDAEEDMPHMGEDAEADEEEPHMDGVDSMPADGRRERRARDDKMEEAEPHMDGEHVEEEHHMDGDAEEEHMDGEHVEEEPHMDGDGENRRERRARDDKKVEEEPHMDGEHVEEEPHMDGDAEEPHMADDEHEEEPHMDGDGEHDMGEDTDAEEPHMDGEHRRGRRARDGKKGTTELHVDVSTSDSNAEIHINGDSIFGGEHTEAEHTEPHMDGEHVEEEPHMDDDADTEEEDHMGEAEEEHRGDRRPRDADEDGDNDVIDNFLDDFNAGMDAQMQDGASDDAEHSDSDDAEHSSDDTEEHEQGSEHLSELLELQHAHDEEVHDAQHSADGGDESVSSADGEMDSGNGNSQGRGRQAKTSDKPRGERRGRNNRNRTRGPRKAREL